MRITNVHERTIAAPAGRIGELLNTLASGNDMFWPHENWSPIRFDRSLQVGATGGHGTGPYTITSYTPGRHIRFDFAGRGRSGYHAFEVQPLAGGNTLLRHSLNVRLPVGALYWWYFVIRPLHDAVLEDLFDKVEEQVSRVARLHVWSARVIRLRGRWGMPPVKRAISGGAPVTEVRSATASVAS